MTEPNEILFDFLERLPITIKEVVLARTCMAFGKLGLEPEQDLMATLRTVAGHSPTDLPFRISALCGAVELALIHEQNDEDIYKRLSAEHPESELFAKMALQAPLKDKHWQSSVESFALLRSGPLSAPALRAWLFHLRAKHPIRI